MSKTHAFFEQPAHPLHRQYEALRAYFYEEKSVKAVAKQFGYSENSLYCFASRFKKLLEQQGAEERFFATIAVGRPTTQHHNSIDQLIIELRKKYLSVSEI
jgi:transposase